jgi:Ran GTPase-activating protein (RanGAP) involved in mRNA processing and transport
MAKATFEKWLAKYENPEIDSDAFDASLRAAYDADPAAYRASWIPRLAALEDDRCSRLREHVHPREADRDWLTLTVFWVYGLDRMTKEIDAAPFRVARLGFSSSLKPADVPKLAAWPHLTRLDEIDFTATKLGDKGLAAFCKSPHLGQLRKLVLNSCGITDAGLATLASTPLTALEHLELSDNKLTAKGIVALVGSPLVGLRFLDIGANDVGSAGAAALAGAEMPKLRTLRAAVCELGDAGVGKLLASKTLRSLAHLELDDNGLTKKTCAALASTALPIRALQLSGIAAGPDGAQQLATATLPKLSSLDLNHAGIGDAGAAAIAGMKSKLVALYLSDNKITTKGAVALGNAAAMKELRYLTLDRNPIGDAGLAAIVETMRKLERVWFEKCELGAAAVGALAKLPQLREVQLRGNKLGAGGDAAYAELQLAIRNRH